MKSVNRKFSYKLLAVIFILKILFLVFGNGFDFGRTYELKNFKGDAKTYLTGANNFVEKGSYEFTDTGDGVTKYVMRMPGLAIVLIPLIYLFSISTAVKLFILLQLLISSIAAVVLFGF